MKRQAPILTQKETMPPQMRGLLPHAAVRRIPDHDIPSNGSAEPLFGHDFSRVSVRPSAPVISQDFSNASCPMFPQRCPFGGACHTCPPRVQAKLKIGQPGDKYEQEADRITDEVMRMPEPRISSSVGDSSLAKSTISRSGTIQRVCAPCSEEYKTAKDENRTIKPVNLCPKCRTQEEGLKQTKQITPLIQRQESLGEEENAELIQVKSTGGVTPEMTPAISSGIHSLQGGGRPLSGLERIFFEPRFGADFSNVRVHDDTRAASVARSVNARAFTFGHNVVFGAGEYSPDALVGRKLLAHELTHTIQQNGMVHKKIQRTLGDGHDLLAERFQGRLALEAAYDNESVIKKGSSGPDVVILQLALIEAGHPLPNFGADGRFGSETKSAVMDFQRANGLQDDGIVGPRTMEVLDGLLTVGPVIAPHCNNPGVARNVLIQPVFFKCGNNDADPTGGSFFTQLTKANEIWSKLGVTFTTNSPVILNDCTNKTRGTTNAEQNAIGLLHTGPGVEVYYVDNHLAGAGGGSTLAARNASNIVLSDFGTSQTLLAHELGHVLSNSNGHPPANGEAGTIMEPSGSHSTPNPERNTIGNLAFIVFPAGTDAICLTPDP